MLEVSGSTLEIACTTEMMSLAERVYVLNQGRIIASGTPAEIRGNPEVIRAYLGDKYVHKA